MTNGQIQQLQDLSKCYPRYVQSWSTGWLKYVEWDKEYRLDERQKRTLRRLTHQYRNQIRAIKRNQEAAG